MEKRCDLRMKHEEKTNEAAAVFQPDVLSQSRGILYYHLYICRNRLVFLV